jgi:hypothetical protein
VRSYNLLKASTGGKSVAAAWDRPTGRRASERAISGGRKAVIKRFWLRVPGSAPLFSNWGKGSAGGASSGPWGQLFRLPSRRAAGARQPILRISRIWGKGAPVALSLEQSARSLIDRCKKRASFRDLHQKPAVVHR